MKRLQDKVAIVTGGAQGIGFSTAMTFAREGAVVVIWDIQEEKAKSAVNSIKNQGYIADFLLVDTTQHEATKAAAEETHKKHGRIDILVNNAGITKDSSLMKMSADQWDKVISVNLTGVFNCTQAVAPYMVDQREGRILNASSVVGLYGNFGQTNYVATKAGVIGMTKVWARELGRKGVRVNAVAPGFIATEMVKTIPEKIINMIKDKTPLGEMGCPQDIANAYLFLASDEAAFINGTVLSVDGGVTI